MDGIPWNSQHQSPAVIRGPLCASGCRPHRNAGIHLSCSPWWLCGFEAVNDDC